MSVNPKKDFLKRHNEEISSPAEDGHQETRREKRVGKEEKLARNKGITRYISVHDIETLPYGKYSFEI